MLQIAIDPAPLLRQQPLNMHFVELARAAQQILSAPVTGDTGAA